MKYIELKELLKDFTLFSLNDIRSVDSSFYRTRLNEWQRKCYIKKIIRGFYIFSGRDLNENHLFEIANKIYNPSYVSFETAFSYYHLKTASDAQPGHGHVQIQLFFCFLSIAE